MNRERIGFVGAGRVGKGLSLALSRAGYEIAGIARRGAAQEIADKADIVFLTVPDDVIESVCQSIQWKRGAAAVHCSGAADLQVLKKAASDGAAIGGFHPLQMFGDPEVAAAGLSRCAIAIEAPDSLLEKLNEMVKRLGATPLHVPSGGRAAYHAAAHYAAAFFCGSLDEAIEIWKRLGIPPEDGLPALLSLARGALDGIERSGPARAMAGSIARGDLPTVKRHVAALATLGPEFSERYCRMALRTIPLARAAGGVDETRAEELSAFLWSNLPK